MALSILMATTLRYGSYWYSSKNLTRFGRAFSPRVATEFRPCGIAASVGTHHASRNRIGRCAFKQALRVAANVRADTWRVAASESTLATLGHLQRSYGTGDALSLRRLLGVLNRYDAFLIGI